MKKQRYILKMGVALTLLLFSTATRSNVFAMGSRSIENATHFSTDRSHDLLISSDSANYISLICEDDNSDDDDDNHAHLFYHKKNKIRVLYHEKHFCYHLQNSSSTFFFSSDTSPPLA